MRLAIQLLTSAGTLFGMWAAGSKKQWAWLIGLLNQILWGAVIVTDELWGIAPLSVALVVVYTRNHLRWKREARAALWLEDTWTQDSLCDAESGFHDEGWPMNCTRLLGHPGDHSHHHDFKWAPGTLATDQD